MTQVEVWDAVNALVNEAGAARNLALSSPSKVGTQKEGDWTWEEGKYKDSTITVKIARWTGPYSNDEEEGLCCTNREIGVADAALW